MKNRIAPILLPALLILCLSNMHGQSVSFNGQASAWSIYIDKTSATRFGIRYIPDLMLERKLPDSLSLKLDLSFNAYASTLLMKDRSAQSDNAIKPYRAWLRFTSDAFEARAGLQKINFGSATLFRPLMWFDRIDPRDPLQLTDGVYALLLRYYFQKNANVWFWGLIGNDSTKGMEALPTVKKSIEVGGRFQTIAGPGEAGLSFHHRDADTGVFHGLTGLSVPENRIGIDGKWDLGIGAWFEAVLINGRSILPGRTYQRQYTVGFDYTIETGNGLTVLAEYFRSEAAVLAFGPSSAVHFGGVSFTYPLGTVDKVSGIIYRDFTHNDTYRFLTWQVTYDNWSFYAMAFMNPETLLLSGPQGGNVAFAGTGGQIMLVFNH